MRSSNYKIPQLSLFTILICFHTYEVMGSSTEWYAIKIENKVVTEIRLQPHKVEEKFQSNLLHLYALNVFDLGANIIRGDISIQLARSQMLEELFFSNNNFI